MPTESKPPRPITARIAIWFVVALCAAIDVMFPLVLEWVDGDIEQQILVAVAMVGVLIGQACFVLTYFGFGRPSWLGGYLLGLPVTMILYLVLLMGAELAGNNGLQWEQLLMVGFVPLLLFAGMLPLLLWRHLRGWRLVSAGAPGLAAVSLGIEELLGVVAIAACGLVLMRAPSLVLESDPWNTIWSVLIIAIILFVIGLVLVPLSLWLGLGVRRRVRAIGGLVLLAVAVFVLIAGGIEIAFHESLSNDRFDVLWFILALVGAAVAMYDLSLLVMYLGGLTLRRQTGKKPAESNADVEPSDDDRVAQQQRWLMRHRKRVRWGLAMLIVLTTGASIFTAALQSWRNTRDREVARLGAIAERSGGHVDAYDRRISVVELGPKATIEDLDQFRHCQDVERLHLCFAEVTGEALERLEYFPQVHTLSLAGSGVTDEGLKRLEILDQLLFLELNQTRVTGAGLRALPTLHRLHADDSSFNDAGCMAVPSSVQHLSLRNCQVTDTGVRHLARLTNLSTLDLSGTSITGRGLRGFHDVEWLDLSDTCVSDDSLESMSELKNLSTLNLGKTPITDTACDAIPRLFPSLDNLSLDGTAITNQGVARLNLAMRLGTLDVSNTQVTGDAFRDWIPQSPLANLSLAGTHVDDASIKHLRQLNSLKTLTLSGTSVSDACLPQLSKLSLQTLDLADTKVTAQGLLNNGLPGVRYLTLAAEQFSARDMARLERGLSCRIEIADDERGTDPGEIQ